MENLTGIEHKKYEKAKKRVKAISGFYQHLMIYILVNLGILAVKYFNIENEESYIRFSTFSTAFFWGIGLMFHALSVFGASLFLGWDWEEKKIRELMDKQHKSDKRWE